MYGRRLLDGCAATVPMVFLGGGPFVGDFPGVGYSHLGDVLPVLVVGGEVEREEPARWIIHVKKGSS